MILKKLLALLMVITPAYVLAGGIVANGGDTLYCQESQLTPRKGYYTLDYMFALAQSSKIEDFVKVTRWSESASRIKFILSKADLKLSKDFEKFYQGSLAVLDGSFKKINYSWIPSKKRIQQVRDEGKLLKIPDACKINLINEIDIQFPDEFSIIQTVIRTEFQVPPLQSIRLYKYSEEVFLNLLNDPLQLSMIFVHEWSWDHTKNVDHVRKLNQFLHLKSTDHLTDNEIKNFLKEIDLL